MKRLPALAAIGVLLATAVPGPSALVGTVFTRPEIARSTRTIDAQVDRAILAIYAARQPAQTIITTSAAIEVPSTTPEPAVAVAADLPLAGRCVGAEVIDAALDAAGSPAVGVGAATVRFCEQYAVSNALWLAMFRQESSYGTNPNWAGIKADGSTTANTGNIICLADTPCYGRFADFGGDWERGAEAHFRLLSCYQDSAPDTCSGYWKGPEVATLEEALARYAPPVENNTEAYTEAIVEQMAVVEGDGLAIFGGEGPNEIHEAGHKIQRRASVTLPMDGCKATNIHAAFAASPGLQRFSIEPGEAWSFNENWQIANIVECGVLGGGVCSYAAAIDYVARQVGLTTESVHHGITFEPSLDDAAQVAIWSAGGRGGQDLTVYGGNVVVDFVVYVSETAITVDAEVRQ